MVKSKPHLERPLARVGPIVHLQSALAAKHAVADDALVRVRHLVLDVVHKLLQLHRLGGLLDFHQRLPSVVV